MSITIFEAKEATFDCQDCGGVMVPTVYPNENSDLGFDITKITCQSCGSEITPDEFSAAELLGV